MLTHLSIRNLLLLKSCDIEFASGLNVLTGETGAGKSILLDALGLVLGERSDVALIRAGEDHASVSAEFDIASDTLTAVLAELELPQEKPLLLRRTLHADGKSRAFVNDASVTVAGLKRIGSVLVERHGQHDQRGLLDTRTHRRLLDRYADHGVLLKKTSAAFAEYRQAQAHIETLRASIASATTDQEWLRMLVDELRALNPHDGEETQLLEARKQAQVARQSSEQLRQALALLFAHGGVAPTLRQVTKLLERTADDSLSAIIEAFTRAENEVEEASVALEKLVALSHADPEHEEQTDDRLHALRDASRKYRVPVDGLQALRIESEAKLKTLVNFDAQMHAAEEALRAATALYAASAGALHASRVKAAARMIKAVMQELKSLKMATTELRVVYGELAPHQWGAEGMHSVAFEVATNKGQGFGALSKVASGGELSRLLLAMKVVLRGDAIGTSIFDEIDTGTGGAVAEAIGLRLKALADTTQVLVVTHLPQVAAHAAHHLFISKQGTKHVETLVTVLNKNARAEELARMLSGATISDEARAAAGKMLQAAS